MNKKVIDLIAMVCLLIAIVTGFMLHSDVHHRYVYDNHTLWYIHEAAGIIMGLAVIIHCFQHKFWFKNYVRIPVPKKRITTILLVICAILIITGIILMCGSHSKEISIAHYAMGIIFTVMAAGHVIKRWKLFKHLFK